MLGLLAECHTDMLYTEGLLIEAATLQAKANKKRIAKAFTNPAVYIPEKMPVSVFMAGCAGAGKTEAAIELIAELDASGKSKIMRIDPDDFRSEFEGYTGNNSWMFQYPVSILVDKIHDMALEQSQSFILDGTLCNLAKAEKNISRSLKRHRDCVVIFVYQKPELAWRFVAAREKIEGRRIPPEIFVEQFFTTKEVVNSLKKKFGKDIRVDLLVKNTDASPKSYEVDVSKIEDHLHDGYDREGLLKHIKSGVLL